MADGSLVFNTKLNTSGLIAGLSKLGSGIGGALKLGTAAISAASSGLTALGAYAISVGTGFDSAMSQVAATMGKKVTDIQELTDAAKYYGETTQFSATQAAQAENYLALAGYDTEKALKVLPTVLDLAAAGDMDLAYASDLVTDSMSVLGLGADEMTGYADMMAKTAQSSNTSVSQLGEATLIAGGQAKLAGMDVVDMNTALGILADNGIKGSEGGTALRNTLKNLYTPTSQAEKAMKKLNVSYKNADGTLKDSQVLLQELNTAMSGLSEADRMKAMSDIFDTETIAAANALLENSGVRWDELSEKIANSGGAASDMAKTMLDNLEGDKTLLKSAAEGFGLELYTGLSTGLRGVTQLGTSIITELTTALKTGGITGLTGALGNVLSTLVTKAAVYAPKMIKLANKLIKSLISGLKKNSKTLATGLADMLTSGLSGMAENLPELITFGLDFAVNMINAIADNLPTLIPQIATALIDGLGALLTNIPALLDAGANLVNSLVEGIKNADLGASLQEMFDSVFNGNTRIRNAVANDLKYISDAYETFKTNMATINTELAASYISAQTEYESAMQLFDEYKKLTESKELTTEQQDRLAEVVDLLCVMFPELKDKIDPTTGAFDMEADAIENVIKKSYLLAIQTATLEAHTEALKEMIKAQMDLSKINKQIEEAQTQKDTDYSQLRTIQDTLLPSIATGKTGSLEAIRDYWTELSGLDLRNLSGAAVSLSDYFETSADGTPVLENNNLVMKEGVQSGTAVRDINHALHNSNRTLSEDYYTQEAVIDELTQKSSDYNDEIEKQGETLETTGKINEEVTKALANPEGYDITSLQEMTQGFVDYATGAGDAGTATDELGTAAENTGDKLTTLTPELNKFPPMINACMTDAETAVTDGGADVVDAEQGVFDSMGDTAGSADTSPFYDIGSLMMQGVTSGWISQNAAAYAQVGLTIRNMVKAAQEAAEIHSPSHLFRDAVGSQMALGVGVGWTDKIKLVYKQMKDSLQDGVKALNAGDFGVNLSAGMNNSGSQIDAMSRKLEAVQQVINFNYPMQAPDEVARAIYQQRTYGLAGA